MSLWGKSRENGIWQLCRGAWPAERDRGGPFTGCCRCRRHGTLPQLLLLPPLPPPSHPPFPSPPLLRPFLPLFSLFISSPSPPSPSPFPPPPSSAPSFPPLPLLGLTLCGWRCRRLGVFLLVCSLLWYAFWASVLPWYAFAASACVRGSVRALSGGFLMHKVQREHFIKVSSAV